MRQRDQKWPVFVAGYAMAQDDDVFAFGISTVKSIVEFFAVFISDFSKHDSLQLSLFRCFVKFEFYYHYGVGQFIYWQVLQPQIGFVFYVIGRYQIYGTIYRFTCV